MPKKSPGTKVPVQPFVLGIPKSHDGRLCIVNEVEIYYDLKNILTFNNIIMDY